MDWLGKSELVRKREMITTEEKGDFQGKWKGRGGGLAMKLGEG